MANPLLIRLIDQAATVRRNAYALFLRQILFYLGKNPRIRYPLYLSQPQKISIGDEVDIRLGCGFYGRSTHNLGIKIGNRCRIKEHCILDAYSGYIHLGEQVLVGQASTIHGHGGVEVGDYTLMGAHVCIFSNEHVYREVPQLIQSQGETWKKTTIGKNVWIGAHAIILAGVNIGDNCVIGAGAIVTSDIASHTLAVGVPARSKKTIGDHP